MAELRVILREWLEEQMAKNDKIVVIDADLAKASGTWAIRQKFPDRAIDVGIAEANMAGVAAGISKIGRASCRERV